MARRLPGQWIRPVSARETEEVSDQERQYKDRAEPKVLDIMDIELIRPCPKTYQQENWLLDPDVYWAKTGEYSWNDLHRLVDSSAPLWINGHDTKNGVNDKIPDKDVESLESSLRLIHVNKLFISVRTPGEAFGDYRHRLLARFRYKNTDYVLKVTDPTYCETYRVNGDYQIGEVYLTISISMPFKGASYKLVATIIEKQ